MVRVRVRVRVRVGVRVRVRAALVACDGCLSTATSGMQWAKPPRGSSSRSR